MKLCTNEKLNLQLGATLKTTARKSMSGLMKDHGNCERITLFNTKIRYSL
jgi:hypothetical protein